MTLRPFDLRDPQSLMRDLATHVSLTEDTAFLLLVAHPSTTQQLLAVHKLRTPAGIGHPEAASDELRETVQSLAIPYGQGPPSHLLMTVLVRRGLCVFGPSENRWLLGWRYVRHIAHAYDGGVVLVTEHGWRDFISDDGGHSPALVELAHRTS